MSKPSSARCIHPYQNRGLTPREGARLQTFSDSYVFEGGLVSIRKQIGNAVPTYLAEAFGYYLKESVFDVPLTDEDRERIGILRSSALDLSEFEDQGSKMGTINQQATFDTIG